MGKSNNPNSTRPLTFDYVKGVARGRWKEIASQVFGIGGDYLTGKHGPCPKCGGSDRWRFTNLEDSGAAICNKCGRFGDGFKLGDWITGQDKIETLRRVADFLGIHHTSSPSRPSKDLERIDLEPLNELLATYWCARKPPVTVPSLVRCRAAHGRLKAHQVLALPAYGRNLLSSPPTRYTIWRADGGKLPEWSNKNATGEWKIVGEIKSRVTSGGSSGLHGPVDELATATHVWKVEGPTDLLAFYSLPDIPAGHVAITNANGAGEKPHRWMLDLLAGKTVYTLHDADQPGQAGVSPWSTTIAPAANVTLPYPIAAAHGKDLRDWIIEGHTFADLLTLAAAATPIPAIEPPADSQIDEAAEAAASDDPTPNEAIDDPHRLARVNLERYAAMTDGGTIRFWREEWYAYKRDRYRKIGAKEFAAKLGASIKSEFDRANVMAQKIWEEKRKEAAKSDTKFTEERPEARKVTTTLLKNVIQATASNQILSTDIEMNSVIDASGRTSTSQRRRWISMQNGIVDLDAILADADDDETLLPHTQNWFSTICLPYSFNPEAQCPKWEAFLKKNLEGDIGRINVLQEWFGYCLIPSTDFQKFLFMEGEGSNGKSVALAVMEAMIGHGNCSHVQLEQFESQFVITQIIGKLVNFSNECSEIETGAEGMLKSIASGDPMTFNRKNIDPIECSPFSRLVLSGNSRPRFADKSFGLWRRMICMPWLVTIAEEEKVIGMDKRQWWERSGELPGIFNWAVEGLARLLEQGRFSDSEVIKEATDSYRLEMNPTKLFLHSNYVAGNHDSCWVTTATMYEHYTNWAKENGYRQVSDTTLGRELTKHFRNAKKKRLRFPDGTRPYAYVGIKPGSPKEDDDDEEVEVFHDEQKELFDAN